MEVERSFLASIVESSDDAIVGITPDGLIATWNAAAGRVYGYRGEEVRGRPVSVLALPERVDEVALMLEKVRRGERLHHFETMHLRRDGKVLSVSLSLSPVYGERGTLAGAALIARDVTGRMRAQEALREAEEKYRLLFAAEPDAILLLDAESGALVDCNPAALRLYGHPREALLRLSLDALVAGPEGAPGEEPLERLRRATRHRRGDGSAFPAETAVDAFFWRGRRTVVGIVRDISERQRIERVRRELAVAKEVQQRLLPPVAPAVAGFELFARTRYCEETGGDFYDFIGPAGDGAGMLGLVVGDVSGHGIGAALLMAMVKGMLLSCVACDFGDLSRLFAALNRELRRGSGDADFMTLFYGILDLERRTLRWNSAGHGPVLWYRRRLGEIRELPPTDVPLGIVADAAYAPAGPVELAPGDVLLIGTDGAWEARNGAGEMFGIERVRQLLATWGERPAAELGEAVIGRVEAFAGGVFGDDLTLMVVKVSGG